MPPVKRLACLGLVFAKQNLCLDKQFIASCGQLRNSLSRLLQLQIYGLQQPFDT